MKNNLSFLVSSFVIALTLVFPQLSFGSDNQKIAPPDKLYPKNSICKFHFVQDVKNDSLTNEAPIDKESLKTTEGNLVGLLCGQKFSKDGLTDKDENTYQTFINGLLIYKPDPESDKGKIVFKMLDFLSSPSVDLSNWGDAAQYLTITTDPSVFFQTDEMDPKFRILINPNFLIKRFEKDHTSHSTNLNKILVVWNEETAPIGMFLKEGNWTDPILCDYLVSSSLVEISSKNLYQNWEAAVTVEKIPTVKCYGNNCFIEDTPRVVQRLPLLRDISCSFCAPKFETTDPR